MASATEAPQKVIEKAPFPRPFDEPAGMTTVELDKNGYIIEDFENKTSNTKDRNSSKSPRALFWAMGAFLLLGVTFLAAATLFRDGYQHSKEIATKSPKVFINHLLSTENACKNSKSFKDCCHILLKTKDLKEIEDCTVKKALRLFLQYELQANKRNKRQEPIYDYPWQQNDNQQFEYGQQISNYQWPIYPDFPEQEIINQEQIDNIEYQNFQDVPMYPFEQSTYNSFTPNEQYYPQFDNSIPPRPQEQIAHSQRNEYYESRDRLIFQGRSGDDPHSVQSDQLSSIQTKSPRFDYEILQNNGPAEQVLKSPELLVTATESLKTKAISEKVSSRQNSNVVKEDQVTELNKSLTSSTLLPKICPDDNCPSVINATTRIANITNIQIKSSGKIRLELNDTNISLSKTKSRISQNEEFESKNKINQNFPSLDIPTGSSVKTLSSCVYPFAPPFRSAAFDGNQIYTIVPHQQMPQQSMFALNPSMYPYIPVQSHNTGNSNPWGFYTIPNRNPIPVSGPGGQFYICNPISSGTGGSGNIVNMPGVEIRSSEAYNLQEEILQGEQETFRNNQTRDAIECPMSERACRDGLKCIQMRHICDNLIDCADGSDEIGCSCRERVGEARLCDGYLDCPNGEDEQGCFDCQDDEFSCDDWSRFRRGSCVSISQRCDGIKQCDITGKDEEDCSVLTDHIGRHPFYKVSNSVGFLHRNFKGKWYPTCFGTELSAVEVCRTEAGPSDILPKTQLMSISDNYRGLFLSMSHNTGITLSDTCLQDRSLFVECPPLYCGLRLSVKNPFRPKEVDTSAEEILSNFQRHGLWLPKHEPKEEVLGIARVVGGKPSQPAAWPWVVSIYKNGIFHCGGVLINEFWVVTAAHCVDKYWFFFYEIQAGMLRRFSYSPMEQNRFATLAIPHERYDKKTLKNDIALMKLSKPIRFNRYVRPICLPSEATAGKNFFNGPAPNTICTTVGWGATVEHGADPDHMREVEIPVLSNCKHIEDQDGDAICAGLIEGGRDACQGDSGGPLMCKNPDNLSQWYLAGIVSHGEGCARPNEPGVYTKVSRYLEWIAENMRDGKFSGRLPVFKCPGYTCQVINKCLPKKRRCDKIVDCLFGDDETDCWRFRETNSILRPQIVGSSHNEVEDVPFEEVTSTTTLPEATITTITSTTESPSEVTTPQFFGCKMLLQVIPVSKVCDKMVDCEDGSDEGGCLCVDYLRKSHPETVCDGITDCSDLSDEIGCMQCQTDEYFCRISRTCVPLKNRCNGIANCDNGEDEWDCVSLTDGRTLVLDSDLRPKQSMKGIITINRFGVWRPLCTNASADNAASIATNACNLLGFEEYTMFYKLSVADKPLNVTFDGFERYRSASGAKSGVSCTGLFVGCSDATLNGHTQDVFGDNVANQVELYTLPWIAAIYLDGMFTCTGTILDENWILAASACFRRDNTPFDKTYVGVLLGNGKSNLSIESPHEQSLAVTTIIQVEATDAVILRTKQKINFNRHIKAARLTTRSLLMNENCIAAAASRTGRTKTKFLEALKECPLESRCFRQLNNSDSCEDANLITSWNGVIVCHSREGFYPAAVLNNWTDSCNFSETVMKYASLSFIKNKIEEVMGAGTDKAVDLSDCDGFRCVLGQCIGTDRVCDGSLDCRSGEDEDLNLCGNDAAYCRPWEFKCRNGRCVPKASFCDRKNDCGDYSDEPTVCSCKTYLELVHPRKICDGTINCLDRSDEDPEHCKCANKHKIKCLQSPEVCVAEEMLCDGFKDCPSGEDETTCYSLRTDFAHLNSGEVMSRTAGVWHSGCFARNHTTSRLEEICKRLGFAGGSARQIAGLQGNVTTAMSPAMDKFDVVWIQRNSGNRLKLRLRTGNGPYVHFVQDTECFKLFIECL